MKDSFRQAATWVFASTVGLAALQAVAGNDVYQALTTEGVPLSSGESVVLPAPTMPDGLSADEQQAVLTKAAGKYPLDRFVRDAVVAPFVLDINSVEHGGKRTGQRIDFHYVAYGSLEMIHDEDLIDELAGVEESSEDDEAPTSARALDEAELAARQLAPRSGDGVQEAYVAIDIPLLEKVQLSGAGLAVQEVRGESITAALRLEDQFLDDPEFPNQWRPINRGAGGKLTLGEPTPYAGMGGYIKVTKLIEPAGALFIECHIAFEEPYGWFKGRNLLRSKLPLVVQDTVRSFRRKLSKAMEKR